MTHKLYLATPMYGGNCTAGYTSSVINLAKRVPYEHMFRARITSWPPHREKL